MGNKLTFTWRCPCVIVAILANYKIKVNDGSFAGVIERHPEGVEEDGLIVIMGGKFTLRKLSHISDKMYKLVKNESCAGV